ncbi:YaeQ family protein [Amantichitinum ursilacus]|uniref:YaeQ protein n=1 Tax=Amantichitinum ursilacus TaxID=857265 RepID=A0A0N0GMY2_9NEIS|nr:YaeQ family protein [Amantichitinum ursilacus]KPC52092.1 YaeQ protein [Amantichitinum ursilacus]
MALKATIYKADLNISDMDRGYYASHNLTIARHPSETDERMMLRVLAFACHASETLAFGRGISDEDDAAVWQKSLIDEVELWIDLGLPDDKRIRKLSQRSQQAWIYAYGSGKTAEMWFEANRATIQRFDNLHVVHVSGDTMAGLAAMAERTMQLQCTIQDAEVWLSDDKTNLQISWNVLK